MVGHGKNEEESEGSDYGRERMVRLGKQLFLIDRRCDGCPPRELDEVIDMILPTVRFGPSQGVSYDFPRSSDRRSFRNP